MGLETFSTTFCGAPSTRSLASFRPRSGRPPRTSLITLIFLSPPAVRTTVNSVCSSTASAGAAAAPAGAAAATGAAAETPHFSSSSLESSEASRTVRADRSPTSLSSLDIDEFLKVQIGVGIAKDDLSGVLVGIGANDPGQLAGRGLQDAGDLRR